MTSNKITIMKSRSGNAQLQTGCWSFATIDLAKWKKYPHDEFAAYKIYDSEVCRWVEQQPIHMWKYDAAYDGNNYLFTEQMETIFLLRWA